MSEGLLFIVCGPSGVGKTTLCRNLLAVRSKLALSVSYTTRAPRGNEEDGVAYHFVDVPTFEDMRDSGAFAEWALVHGNYYGTSIEVIESAWDAGHDLLFDIDYQGASQLMERFPNAVSVLVIPPSMEVLEARLRGRKTDGEAVVLKRLDAAKNELSQFPMFRYLLKNDDLEEAGEALNGIYDASRHLRFLHGPALKQMLEV